MRNFEDIDADIKAAIDSLMTHVPEIEQVALWGLCDAASAALYYGHTDPRVTGLVLLNPWVHTVAGAAHARIKHYYLARLLSLSFWFKLFTGKVKVGNSLVDLTHSARQASAPNEVSAASPIDPRHGSPGYIDRMLKGLQNYTGKVQIILSGNDLTAQEFAALIRNDKNWQAACRNQKHKITMLKEANHTFSTQAGRSQVETQTALWICQVVSKRRA